MQWGPSRWGRCAGDLGATRFLNSFLTRSLDAKNAVPRAPRGARRPRPQPESSAAGLGNFHFGDLAASASSAGVGSPPWA